MKIWLPEGAAASELPIAAENTAEKYMHEYSKVFFSGALPQHPAGVGGYFVVGYVHATRNGASLAASVGEFHRCESHALRAVKALRDERWPGVKRVS